ncbi:MAG TPA: RecQ family ATP-dependent DNA helicase, partial [Candidatus Thermoplasmatota archaeon]|nr:RecQ family ATP-dependent DNA helicase [Candidatus Thermoplasmatota archaeon]
MQPPPVTAEETARAADLARRHMGFASLRPGQAETLARTMRGESVLAILPTGGGKSVCYQLPAVLSPGVTVVVSPLLALMKDQLDSLPPPMRLAAESITSELSPQSLRRVMEETAQGRYRLLYVAPERLRSRALQAALRAAGVKRLVVDEAHCVSVWGHDFRPDYLAIPQARRALGDPPVLAVTATAPPRVAADVERLLGPLARVETPIDRPNLRLEAIVARDADAKLAHLAKLCRETRGPGIVYASSRAKCEQLAEALRQRGVLADAYHAGLPDRARRQEEFMEGRTEVLVATVAFGMGVDKRDIRFVFHHDPPGSLENYYQEAGRAGRDGEPARCVLLASSQDAGTLRSRARRDLPSKPLIEAAWALVLSGAAGDGLSLVDPDALQQLAPGDDVGPRVALGFLEEAGAVERVGEVPRFLGLLQGPPELEDVGGRELSLFDLAARLGVPPGDVEDELLAKGAKWRATARAWLYRVAGDPARVEDVLERRA